MKPSTAIIIPARLQSVRLPEKPLVDIHGQSLIMRVYQQAVRVPGVSFVIVATDDIKILDHVLSRGGHAVMTGVHHASGTDRIGEVVQDLDVDYIINVQGDEPLIDPRQISQLLTFLQESGADIATQCIKINRDEELLDYNVVKVVKDIHHKALYFSRQAIPAVRDEGYDKWLSKATYFRHVGIYGFRKNVLEDLVRLPKSHLEMAESLEQLRWLENGYNVYCQETDFHSIGVDTPEDVEKVEQYLIKKGL
jgi:3-deoxy-manno-octulosonate cytidylyltransferase (CMP-KDO synthetase)